MWHPHANVISLTNGDQSETDNIGMRMPHCIIWLYGIGHMVNDHSENERALATFFSD